MKRWTMQKKEVKAVIIKDILVFLLMTLGMLSFIVSTAGVFRMRDFYCRLHTAGICGTAGMIFFALGLLIYEGLTITGIKIFAILLVAMIASPIGTHIICKVAYKESAEAAARAAYADMFGPFGAGSSGEAGDSGLDSEAGPDMDSEGKEE